MRLKIYSNVNKHWKTNSDPHSNRNFELRFKIKLIIKLATKPIFNLKLKPQNFNSPFRDINVKVFQSRNINVLVDIGKNNDYSPTVLRISLPNPSSF